MQIYVPANDRIVSQFAIVDELSGGLPIFSRNNAVVLSERSMCVCDGSNLVVDIRKQDFGVECRRVDNVNCSVVIQLVDDFEAIHRILVGFDTVYESLQFVGDGLGRPVAVFDKTAVVKVPAQLGVADFVDDVNELVEVVTCTVLHGDVPLPYWAVELVIVMCII